MIGKEVGPYRIIDRLGGGGMGVVYRAEDTRLGRVVALKFLSAELLANETLRKRFLHEARAASLIDHPNVCHVYEVGEAEDGRAYMAMSYCEGRSLREVINSGPVPPREAFSVAFGVAQGLWAAHRRGIVHRDIKPANVILTDEGFVRIVDFGLALLVDSSRVTTTGVTVGTVAYMSPEQTSNSQVSPNTDIWSLGVTLYEMLTGKLPFRGDINAALLYSIVHEPPTPLADVDSSIPKACVRIVDRCLEKDPAKRYQTIEELLEDMVRTARELGWESSVASATIAPILEDRRKRVWRKRIAVVAAAVLVVAGGIWAYREFVPAPSPYTTELRLAVMPLNNMIGADNELLVEALSEHLSRIARWIDHDHPSMWTVPYLSVLNADLPEPTGAAAAFGANRVLTGDVQRFENGYRVNLRLVNAGSGKELRALVIPFETTRMDALLDTLTTSSAQLLDIKITGRRSPWHTGSAQSAADYVEGISLLKTTGENDALDRAIVVLDRAAGDDAAFAAPAAACAGARLQLQKRTHENTLLTDAITEGRAAFARAPSMSEAALFVGDAFSRMEMPDSAEAWYRRAIASEPGYLVATQRLGRLCEDQERIDEAEGVFKNLVTLHPDFWAAYRTLGRFYFEHERVDDATAAWQIALRLAPKDPLTLNNLGAVHHRRGEWAAARALFLRSFQARPDYESSSNVAITLYYDGKFEEAAEYFKFALEHSDTTNHQPWADLARALYWTKDGREQSLAMFRKAHELASADLQAHPDDVELMSSVIDYAAMIDDADEARTMIERIKPLLKDEPLAMYRVGAVYEKLGDRELALDFLASAMRHGLPVPEIKGDPMLKSLVSDPRFQAMIDSEAAAEGAEAATNVR